MSWDLEIAKLPQDGEFLAKDELFNGRNSGDNFGMKKDHDKNDRLDSGEQLFPLDLRIKSKDKEEGKEEKAVMEDEFLRRVKKEDKEMEKEDNTEKETSYEEVRNRIQCDTCQKFWSCRADLIRHQENTGKGTRGNLCRGLQNLDEQERHRVYKQREEEKNRTWFYCDTCPEIYLSKKALKSHKKKKHQEAIIL